MPMMTKTVVDCVPLNAPETTDKTLQQVPSDSFHRRGFNYASFAVKTLQSSSSFGMSPMA